MLSLALLVTGYSLAETFYPSSPEQLTLLNKGNSIELSPCPQLTDLVPVQATNGLKKQFTLLDWNIYKQQNSGWKTQLTELTKQVDLVTLQEVKNSVELNTLSKSINLSTLQNVAFYYQNHAFGVSNLSLEPAKKSCGSTYMEPWIRVAKSALASTYSLEGKEETLLLINLHGVNFTFTAEPLKQQLSPYFTLIKNHQGPVIISGDFNTWTQSKTDLIKKRLSALRLKQVSFSQDQRKTAFGYPLDHVFYRDLKVLSATSIDTDASDHAPILVTFSQ